MKGKWIYLLAVILAAGCGEVPQPQVSQSKQQTEPAGRVEVPALVTDAPISVFFSSVDQTVAHNRSNPTNIAARCVAVIDGAKKTLDVCCHEIDNREIVDAIIRAHRRGVAVRVVGEADYADELGPKLFRQEGIPVLMDSRDALMHNKFMVVDGSVVWTGSFKFTDNGAFKNNNNAVLIADRKVADNFSEKFRWFWEEEHFGRRPSGMHQIPHPIVRMADGTVVETYFSTHDKVDKQLIAALSKANRSIDFLAFSFTHDDIARVMLDRADRGVRVRGVFESRQNSKYSEFDTLAAHRNVQVLLDGNKFNMHHKVIIIDGVTVITGSYNFSTSATAENDENVVIIHSKAVASQFQEEFARVFTEAQRALAGNSGGLLRR